MTQVARSFLGSVAFEPKRRRRDRQRFAFAVESLEDRVVMTTYPTATLLAESMTSGSQGANVTFTATVTSSNGVPTGSVYFEDGSAVLGVATLSGGVASISTNTLAPGVHTVRAVYAANNSNYYVSASSGISESAVISTVAGTGTGGYTGDGGQATSAELHHPDGVAFDAYGDMFISDAINHVVREVDAAGIISTVVGNGTSGNSGDGGPATAAELNEPTDLAFNAAGDLFISDYAANVVREVTPAGIISTFAGTTQGYSGDGGPATSAKLYEPLGLAFNAAGDLFIVDSLNFVVREVNASGVISTVVGNSTAGYSGDGGPATSAELNYPNGIAFNSAGDMFIADESNNVVREVNTSGVISTVAGNHTAGYTGDNGQATSAELNAPSNLTFDAFGDMVISDQGNSVIRAVSPSGVITTVVGTGTSGYSGDGGPAIEATLNYPSQLAINSSGSLFIADWFNNAVREVIAPPVMTYTVTALPAMVSLAVTVGPQSTTFSASVSSSLGFPVSGGTVSFYDGTTLLGVVPVVNGVAVFDFSALSPGSHLLSAVFSGTEAAGASTATQTVTVGGTPSVTGMSRYPVQNNRTLVSLFFDQTLNPAEALWKHNYKLHTSSGGNIKISHIYFDPSSNTVTLLPGHRLALRSTYNLKLLGLNSKSSSKGSSPTVSSSGWLTSNFKAKINHKALSVPGGSACHHVRQRPRGGDARLR